MTNIEKIQATYESERRELLKQYETKAIDKRLHDDFLQQLNSAETMDIMDAMLEGEI